MLEWNEDHQHLRCSNKVVKTIFLQQNGHQTFGRFWNPTDLIFVRPGLMPGLAKFSATTDVWEGENSTVLLQERENR
jgi:hypothetical protein